MESLELGGQVLPNCNFWNGKKVLVTGHSGFKGCWLTLWLVRLGAEVSGVSLPPDCRPSLFDTVSLPEVCASYFKDIRSLDSINAIIAQESPDVIFHLAAQPLVIAGYENPVETFETNIMGTLNVLQAAKKAAKTSIVVVVTTDKVYAPGLERVPFSETDKLGATDPYSTSKTCAELVVQSFRYSATDLDRPTVATVRAGNVIGGGDWSENRLIPDAIRAWAQNKPLKIRQPDAIRPWQHVLEPLAGYLRLAEHLWVASNDAGAFNFGPMPENQLTVLQVLSILSGELNYDFGIQQGDGHRYNEASWLGLDIGKADDLLGFRPSWSAETAIKVTSNWYRKAQKEESTLDLCLDDIAQYELGASDFV